MCGRVNARVSLEDVQKLFSVKEDKDEEEKEEKDVKIVKWVNEGVHSQLHNCAPSETVATLVAEDEVWTTRFGLIPSYKKSTYDRKRDHYVAFNCRSETILERQMFNRCTEANAKDKGRGRAVVLIRGFYEWKKDKMGKQPYYVSRKDGELLCVCAVMDTYKGDDFCDGGGEILRTTSLLTRDSKGTRLSWLHDRMPVMLKKEAVKTWLTDKTKGIASFLKYDETTTHQGGGGVIEKGEDLQWYPVTPEMGKIEFQGDACVKEVVAVAKKNTQDIKSMFAKVVAKQSAEKLSQVKIDAFAETANCDKEDEPPAKKKLKL